MKQKINMNLNWSLATRPSIVLGGIITSLCVVSSIALAQTDASIQSAARPLGLNILSKVKAVGSDAKSAVFQKNSLPELRKLAMLNLPEGKALSSKTIGLHKIDPNKLKLSTNADVRVYFLGEGAGFHNCFGVNTSGPGVTSGTPKLLFPDASTSVSNNNYAGTGGVRTNSTPLLPGDFVDIGNVKSGTQLNFFNISDGANSGRNVFSTQHSSNPDGLVHAVAYALPDSPYLLIGFEDLWGGGDKDYNDVMFTIDVGMANVIKLSGPEPAMPLLLSSFLMIVGFVYRRQKQQLVPARARVRSSIR